MQPQGRRQDRTLPVLCGLLISMSGDLTSPAALGIGDFSSGSSCASSSISVDSVPFESTGDGSIWFGYGLGGGASESVGPDDLQAERQSRVSITSQTTLSVPVRIALTQRVVWCRRTWRVRVWRERGREPAGR